MARARPDSFGPLPQKRASSRPRREHAPHGETLGRYRLLGELGHGGMAFLYLARAEGPAGFGRLVAIKVLHTHLSRTQDFVHMFLDEARTAARIHHPNVVPVHEVGEANGEYFIVMDYVSGENLAFLLERTWGAGKPFPVPLAAHLIACAAEGLHAAHELTDRRGQPLDVVHRDVSPQNMLVGFDGVLRVVDFGIAKAADRVTHTKPGALKGKLDFMAPEQVLAKPVDRRTDVFALGVVFWESTTGKRLFRDESDMLTARRIVEMPAPPPSALVAGYPKKLEQVVLRALAKDPADRFATAKEMAQSIREVLAEIAPRIGAEDVQRFMTQVADDRLARRRELERRASLDPDADLSDAMDGSLLSDLGAVRRALDELGGSPLVLTVGSAAAEEAEVITKPHKTPWLWVGLAIGAVVAGVVAAEWSIDSSTVHVEPVSPAKAQATPVQPAQPASAQAPAQPSPSHAEPSPTEPSPTEPSPTEPSHAAPSPPEPSPPEPSHAEPSPTDPARTIPSSTTPPVRAQVPADPNPPAAKQPEPKKEVRAKPPTRARPASKRARPERPKKHDDLFESDEL
ncbi:MAG: protein kinase [Deltaproteobacteria bacterium]|nr:protein kinase [Deltaproteobacteria bacterium]